MSVSLTHTLKVRLCFDLEPSSHLFLLQYPVTTHRLLVHHIMSDTNRTQSPPDTSDPKSTVDRSFHSVSSNDTDSNDDIVNKVFDEKLQLNDHTTPTDASASDEEYSDAVSDSLPLATDTETAAEAERRQHEQTLSVEQLAENESKANEIKTFGNLQFKNEEYKESLESYTEGLDVCPLANSDQRAVLLGNRSAAYMQLGNTASALIDASKALELKPDYMKVLLRYAKFEVSASRVNCQLISIVSTDEPSCTRTPTSWTKAYKTSSEPSN